MAREIRRSMFGTTNATLYVYDEVKYTASKEVFENAHEVKYENLINWEIISKEDAIELDNEYINAGEAPDWAHEYLVLNFKDGSKATFRNSYCDLFVL